MKNVWVAGRIVARYKGGVPRWEVLGIFSAEDEAVAICEGKDDFVAPAPVGCRLMASETPWTDGYFPMEKIRVTKIWRITDTELRGLCESTRDRRTQTDEGGHIHISLTALGLLRVGFGCSSAEAYWNAVEHPWYVDVLPSGEFVDYFDLVNRLSRRIDFPANAEKAGVWVP